MGECQPTEGGLLFTTIFFIIAPTGQELFCITIGPHSTETQLFEVSLIPMSQELLYVTKNKAFMQQEAALTADITIII